MGPSLPGGLEIQFEPAPSTGTSISMTTNSGPVPWTIVCGDTVDCSDGRVFFPDWHPDYILFEFSYPDGSSGASEVSPTYQAVNQCAGSEIRVGMIRVELPGLGS